MNTISAVIITFNEEKNIGRTLDALVGWVHEIIILDSGSTDRTKEICLGYADKANLKWFEQKWLGFGQQKNKANTLATGDYILSLDADEVVSPELQDDILKNATGELKIGRVNRLTNYCGHWVRHCGWRPDYQWRFFSREKAKWNDLQVHEHLVFDEKLATFTLKGDLWHYSYHSVGDHWRLVLPYARLGAQRVAHKSKIALALKMVLNPPLRFMKCYFLQFGFLDGYYGLVICLITAYGVFMKYSLALRTNGKQRSR